MLCRGDERQGPTARNDDSHFTDPTGLSPDNRSSASDLVRLVKAAYEHDVIRQYSVSGELALPVGKRMVSYRNTNRLTDNPEWDIGLQKTGYISAAGRCLVMQAVVEGQRIVMVLLDSVGKYSRLGDAQRIRHWLTAKRPAEISPAPARPVANTTARSQAELIAAHSLGRLTRVAKRGGNPHGRSCKSSIQSSCIRLRRRRDGQPRDQPPRVVPNAAAIHRTPTSSSSLSRA